jgi:hypothetical protein
MTVLTWPTGRRRVAANKLIVDPLPQAVLRQMVSGVSGPKDETAARRTARFEAQLAAVLKCRPRNSAEAMMATHFVIMRLAAEHLDRSTTDPTARPAIGKKLARASNQLLKMISETEKSLAHQQAHPLELMDVATATALSLGEYVVPASRAPDEGFSATINPLHPGPKTLQ